MERNGIKMSFDEKRFRDLAERIYDLDTEVYKQLGSSLGRVFNGDREKNINDIVVTMESREKGYKMRSELALISNMARTIPDKKARKEIMHQYNEILRETKEIPTSFGSGDIVDPAIAKLNLFNLKERFKDQDHLVICIGRSYGCGGNEIGFTLADELKINFYDVSIMNEILSRMDADDNAKVALEEKDIFVPQQKLTPKKWINDFNKYHGLSESDAQFFKSSKLLCDMAKEEDFIIMGRYADVVLTNNHIPHVSIFITAPFNQRVQRIKEISGNLTDKQARQMVELKDAEHMSKYFYYTGRKWGMSSNYDICINSASYGIQGSVEVIKKMLDR